MWCRGAPIFFINLPIGRLILGLDAARARDAGPRAGGALVFSGRGGLNGSGGRDLRPPSRRPTEWVSLRLSPVRRPRSSSARSRFVRWSGASSSPMLPLEIFSSAIHRREPDDLRGLRRARRRLLPVGAPPPGSLGYSPIASGAASLPVTMLMLAVSRRAGALAQRMGPRPQSRSGRSWLRSHAPDGLQRPRLLLKESVLPAALVFGLGLTITVAAPLTSTAVLAAVDGAHAGIASGRQQRHVAHRADRGRRRAAARRRALGLRLPRRRRARVRLPGRDGRRGGPLGQRRRRGPTDDPARRPRGAPRPGGPSVEPAGRECVRTSRADA